MKQIIIKQRIRCKSTKLIYQNGSGKTIAKYNPWL